jgi:uncharacterized protein (DUF433 family)
MDKRSKPKRPAVHCDPDILDGTPVFLGTRVPFRTLMDYLEAGHPLSDFLSDFPTVTRRQVLAALDQATEAVLASARVA